jgi:hypothetical protein
MEKERVVRKTITEEHVVLLSESGSIYLGHVTPISGSSHNIKTRILTFFFLEKNVYLSKLQLLVVMEQCLVQVLKMIS